jgi:hypothetical protein
MESTRMGFLSVLVRLLTAALRSLPVEEPNRLHVAPFYGLKPPWTGAFPKRIPLPRHAAAVRAARERSRCGCPR